MEGRGIQFTGASRKSDLRSTGLGEALWKMDGALEWLGWTMQVEHGVWHVPSWDVVSKVTSEAKQQLVGLCLL